MRKLTERTRQASERDATSRSAVGSIPTGTGDAIGAGASAGASEVRKAERRELARELHDTVVQPLTALLMSMETLAEPREGEVSQVQLDAWKALAREAMQSLRSTMTGLRTHPHAQLGLPDALRRHLIPQVETRGLRVTVQASAWPEDLPDDWTTSLYLTVREALMNVEKHAHAAQCVVVLRGSAQRLAITIIDDGVGFTHKRATHARPTAQGTGFGLGAMRDRVRALGGRLTLTTAPGRGTRIEIVVPRSGEGSTRAAAPRRRLVENAATRLRANGCVA